MARMRRFFPWTWVLDTVREARKLTRLRVSLVALIILSYWLVFFFPIIGRGQYFMPYQFLANPGISGLEANAGLARGLMALPNNDYALTLIHYPAFKFTADGYDAGRLPLWNPYIGCGAPVDPDPQYKAFDPFMGLFYLIPSPWTFWVGLGLEALVGMFGFYLLLRRLGFSSIISSVWAGFAVFNPWTQQMMLLSSVWADWLLGWGLLAAWVASRGGWRSALLPGIACAFFLFCGHPEEALILTGIVMLAFLGFSLEHGLPWGAIAGRVACFILTVGGLSAVYVWPYLAARSLFASYKDLWSGVGGYPVGALFDPSQMVWVPPLLWGLVFVALAQGVLGGRLASALVILGGLIAFKWPHLDELRGMLALNHTLVAIYAQTLFWIGLIWLSAMGSKAIAEASADRRHAMARSLMYGFVLYYVLSWAHASSQFKVFWPSVYVMVHRLLLLAGILCLASLYVRGLRPVLLAASLLLMLAVSPLLPMAPFRFLAKDSPADSPPGSVQFLQTCVGPHDRFSGFLSRERDGRVSDYPMLTPNQCIEWGLRDIRVSGPYWLSCYATLHDRWAVMNRGFTTSTFSRASAGLLAWLGVTYVAVPHGQALKNGFQLAYSDTIVDVWKVSGAPARARMVYDWVRCDDDTQAARMTQKGLSDDGRSFCMPVAGLDSSGPKPASRLKWRLRWEEDSPERVKLLVETNRAGLLFLADTFHPGWQAQVDGRPCRIFKAMGAFRAVSVPVGTHCVTMHYVSRSFRVGAILSLLTVGVLLFMGAIAGWRRVHGQRCRENGP